MRFGLIGIALALASCGDAGFAEGRENAYGLAVESSLEEEWESAANASYAFVKNASIDEERYDRAIMLLAQSLEGLDLRYPASLHYLDVAESRRNVELLDAAFAGLERVVRAGPHDDETIIDGFVATGDIYGLRTEQQAFVDYYQALDSVRRGLDSWADQLFARIPESSPYHDRAVYAQAVRQLGLGQVAEGEAKLKTLLEDDELPGDVRRDSSLALARVAMEAQRYDDAVRRYEAVRGLAPTRPELLLEMAWAHFYRGDSRRALGLLVALDAPIYRGLIAPERFLLEASCLRRLCQFEPARLAAVRLRESYGEALSDLHRGLAPTESTALRQAASRRGTALEARRFLDSLLLERKHMHELGLSAELVARLDAIYRVGIEEGRRRVAARAFREADALAGELIEAEDGVRVTLHELSVALLRGRQRPAGVDEVDAIDTSAGSGRTSFSFGGEFWTDELDDLVVVIPDRCLE